MRQRIPQSPLDKLAARIEAGNTIADAIMAASLNAPIATRHQSQALAMRIRQCNHPANSWYIPNATKKPIRLDDDRIVPHPDQPFDAIGRFWRCGSKLCPDCLARQSRHSRKRLREALNAQKPAKAERYYFSTFTIPNVGLGLTETRSIVNRAWTLFRKRKLCASLIRGGAKSEEFTVTAKGFHYHLHTLWLSRWISYQEVRRNWTECVEQAFDDHGRPFHCANKDGLLSVVVKLIIPTERSIQEVCKYVTKSDSWTKVPPSDLIEIAMIRKWNRMFEVFGSFRLVASEDVADEESILDTRLPSDGTPRAAASYWRDRVSEQNLTEFADSLTDEFHRCVIRRRHSLEARYNAPRIYTYAEIISKRAGP